MAAVIVRMDALKKVKDEYGYVYDERLRFHEDWDLWLRFLSMRGRVVFREENYVSNWFDNPAGRHRSPLNKVYKHIVYSRIRGGYYDR